MNLPTIDESKIQGKSVVIRADLDMGDSLEKSEIRLDILINTLLILIKNKARITIIGHRGRPAGQVVEKYSLKEVSLKVEELITERIGKEKMKGVNMHMVENLRFEKGEEENDKSFAIHLAKGQDYFVNEAFAASHRNHASIVTLPNLLPHAVGPHFAKEVENLEKVFKTPKRPVVFILSGIKDDKLVYAEAFSNIADKVLIGGRLPESIHDASSLRKNSKFVIANLIADKEDITIHSIEAFETAIQKAGTIVVSGPMGRFEDDAHTQGTKRVFEAIGISLAFKVAGGGETRSAISKFGLTDKFDWISVGGGAMLEFLSTKTLPGIQALLH